MCVWGSWVIILCLSLFIHPGTKWVSFWLLPSCICCIQTIWYAMGLGTCLLTPCTISLSPLACRAIWKHCQIYSVNWLSKIRSIFTFIFYILNGTVTYQLIHFCFDDFENTSSSFYYHHLIKYTKQIFRVRPWNKVCAAWFTIWLSTYSLSDVSHSVCIHHSRK